MNGYTFDAGTNVGDVSETHFRANGTEAGDAALDRALGVRPPIEGITIRSNNAGETHGTDGGFAWRSSEGQVVELHADGFFRIEGADGSEYLSHPDGGSEFHRDGAHVHTDPYGRITWRGEGRARRVVDVEQVVAGSLLRTDGLEGVFGNDVAREFNLTGEVVGMGRGDIEYERYEGGGTVTTDHDTDTIILDDGNGRVRHYEASGEITFERGGRDAWN